MRRWSVVGLMGMLLVGVAFTVALLPAAPPTATSVPVPPVLTHRPSPEQAVSGSPSRMAVSPTPQGAPATVDRIDRGTPEGKSADTTGSPARPSATAAPPGDPSHGRVLFEQKGCVLCHGDRGEGLVGPRIAGTKLSFAEVLKQVRNPRGVMQQYQPADLSDEEVRDIYAYLRTLP